MYKISYNLKKHNLTSSFQSGVLYFYCLIAIALTSSIMLNWTGESGHPFVVPDPKGKVFNLLPLSMMLAVDLSSMAFIMLMLIPLISNFIRIFIR